MKCVGFLLLVAIFGFGMCGSLLPHTSIVYHELPDYFPDYYKDGLIKSPGFSVGDELGFKESISNTEINRRRSTGANKFEAQLIQAQQKQKKTNPDRIMMAPNGEENGDMDVIQPMSFGKIRTTGTATEVPPFRPIPPAPERVFASNKTKSSSVPMAVLAVPKRVVQESVKRTQFADKMLSTSDKDLLPLTLDMQNSIKPLLANPNITEDLLEAAIKQKTQMLGKLKNSEAASSSQGSSVGKVMNAPKEYYPVGYEKNFDDNFASRVELPETSFHCGDQKHFPGLYADEDLGCMVFHVCALTEDGLIMKSFLCPESTLFDQTILKCNWWFYVDCKSSRKLYDSNIPISKSYQLMKALTFFSEYKKNTAPTNTKPSGAN